MRIKIGLPRRFSQLLVSVMQSFLSRQSFVLDKANAPDRPFLIDCNYLPFVSQIQYNNYRVVQKVDLNQFTQTDHRH